MTSKSKAQYKRRTPEAAQPALSDLLIDFPDSVKSPMKKKKFQEMAEAAIHSVENHLEQIPAPINNESNFVASPSESVEENKNTENIPGLPSINSYLAESDTTLPEVEKLNSIPEEGLLAFCSDFPLRTRENGPKNN